MIDPVLDHVGVVVPDLAVAMEMAQAQLGIATTIVFDDALPANKPGAGDRVVRLRIAYSEQRPAALELIEAAPGSPWSPDHAGLHHLAYRVDDLGTESARLAGLCPIEICGRDDGRSPRMFTYRTGGLFRIELLAPRLA
jgi:hypothetical protein